MRAILVAAGMGTRLRPLTEDTPKSLIEVNGMSLLERQIIMLREKGIEDIIVLTGYLHQKFDALVEKYGLIKVINDKYDVYNNIYTMYLVREYLSDAIVIDADNYLKNNFLPNESPEYSTYYSPLKKNVDNEWVFRYDDTYRITNVYIGTKDDKASNIMSGVSYWNKKDGKFIGEKIEEFVQNDGNMNEYWDSIPANNLDRINVKIVKLTDKDIFEIDSLQDLQYLKDEVNIKK